MLEETGLWLAFSVLLDYVCDTFRWHPTHLIVILYFSTDYLVQNSFVVLI